MKTFLSILCLSLAGVAFSVEKSKVPSVNLDGKAKQALVETALRLKKGDSYEAVVSKLGKPTFDRLLQRKEEQKPFGRSLKYYAVIWESGLVNEPHDEYVVVSLDALDKVQSITIRVTLDK